MGLNHEVVGKWFDESRYEVTADAIKKYAASVNDENPAYDKGDDSIAPPLFPIVSGWNAMAAGMGQVLTPDLYMMVVHLVQDMRFVRPIKAGDTLVSKGCISGIEGSARGTKVTGHVVYDDAQGDPIGEFYATIYIRGHNEESNSGKPAPATTVDSSGDVIAQLTQQIDLDQTQRYAEASGDHNPIHLDDDFAKSVGLPGIINHGMNTLAQVCWTAVETLCESDSTRLTRFAGRFSKPVLPGETLNTSFRKTEDKSVFTFETQGPGGVVVKDGVAQVARPPA